MSLIRDTIANTARRFSRPAGKHRVPRAQGGSGNDSRRSLGPSPSGGDRRNGHTRPLSPPKPKSFPHRISYYPLMTQAAHARDLARGVPFRRRVVFVSFPNGGRIRREVETKITGRKKGQLSRARTAVSRSILSTLTEFRWIPEETCDPRFGKNSKDFAEKSPTRRNSRRIVSFLRHA